MPQTPARQTPSRPTLEQMRAADAWARAQGCGDDYMKLAKGLPALIMNSGLLQVMAFLHEKGGKNNSQRHCRDLAQHLRQWLHGRFPLEVRADFTGFMEDLMKAPPRSYQAVTTEAFAWLRWVRQMSAAVRSGRG